MEIIDKYIPEFTNTLLNRTKINFDSYTMLTVEDNISISANPYLCTLISFLLKNDINVILAASFESLHHYSSILKKFGLNLNNNDKFCFIDLFYSPFKKVIKQELPLSESFPYTYNTNRSKFYHTNIQLNGKGRINFKELTNTIDKQMKKFPNPTNQTVLLFDNLSTLPNTPSELMNDLNLIIKFCSDKTINLVVNVNKEISGNEFYYFLEGVSDLKVELKQNESGYSKDVNGLIKFIYNTTSNKEWSLRYSVKENGINFFPHLII